MSSGDLPPTDEATATESQGLDPTNREVLRVVTPGKPKFQLQKGEAGLSVFDPNVVSPALTDNEVLGSYRPGSLLVTRTVAEIIAQALRLMLTPGDPRLPSRLQQAHAEIVPGPGMTRNQFKVALRGLE